MIVAIGPLPVDALHPLEPGEIGKGLQLNGDEVHLLLLRDVLARVGGQQGLRGRLVVPLRRLDAVRCDAVEEGVEEPLGEIQLSGGPAVDVVEVLGAVVVEIFIRVHAGHGHRQDHPGGAEPRPHSAPGPATDQKPQQQRPRQDAEQSEPDPLVRRQVVVGVLGDGPRLPDILDVLEHQGVIPATEQIVVGQGQSAHRHRGHQEGQPRPAQQPVDDQQQQQDRQDVQQGDQGMGEVACKQRPVIGAEGKGQGQRPQADACQQQRRGIPNPEQHLLPRLQTGGGGAEQPEVLQSVSTSLNENGRRRLPEGSATDGGAALRPQVRTPECNLFPHQGRPRKRGQPRLFA